MHEGGHDDHDHDHNHVNTRKQLKEYDLALAELCEEVMGDKEWRFVSPRERAGQGHLKGYDPKDAPVVDQLPHIKVAANDYYDKYWKVFWQRLYDKNKVPSPHTRSLFNGKDLTGWGFRAKKTFKQTAKFDGKKASDDGRYRAINGRLGVTTPP